MHIFRHGIEVLGISSDGDERLLRAMKTETSLDLTIGSDLSQHFVMCPIKVQDTTHIATKLRNRFLNSSILLQMGSMSVTVEHIKDMLLLESKEVHGLFLHDVCPDDRQNYSSFEKITEQCVLQSLKKHIVDSDATVMYLDLCKDIASSFLDRNLEPIERIYKIWHAVYFLRCWRKWIQSSNFTLDNNFLTRNSYLCIELNAHAIVHLIIRLRTDQQQNLFLPDLFSSQPCEYTFRQMRSMGTANFTKINFNLYELLHMIARVEIMNKVMHTYKEINFPRMDIKAQRAQNIAIKNNFPSNENIINTMKRAQSDAIKDAAKFDMHFSENDINMCEIEGGNDQSDETTEEELDFFDYLEQSMAFELELEEYENTSLDQVSENEKIVEVTNLDGTTKNVRKSTYVWLLSESKDKLSADRLRRVQVNSDIIENKSKKRKPNISGASQYNQYLFKAKELEIGEWAVFDVKDKSFEEILKNTNLSDLNFMENFWFGFVVGFSLNTVSKTGQMKHKRQYKKKYVETDVTTMDSKSSNEKNENDDKVLIRILCVWYTCDQSGSFHLVPGKDHKPIYIKNYVGTLKKPTIKRNEKSENVSYILPCEISEIKQALFELTSSIPKS